MDKNVFDMVEPAYEPLSEQDELKILAAVTAKTGAGGTAGADVTGGADAVDRTTGAGVAAGGADIANASGAGVPGSAGMTGGADGADRERRRKTASGRAGFGKSTTPSTSGRGRHGRRIAVIAVAAVLAFGAVAFASTAIDPDSPLLALFNLDGKQLDEQEAQLIQSSGTFIGKTVEKNGVKIHVKEAIGDKDTVYLLVDVTPPKDLVKPGMEYTFERIDLKEAFPSLIESGSGMMGWSSRSELSEDGAFQFILSATASNGVQGKKFTLELSNLQRFLTIDSTDEASGADTSASPSADASSAAEEATEDSGLIETYGVDTGDNGEINEYKITTDEDGNIIDYVTGAAVDGNVDGNLTSGYDQIETIVEGDWKVKFTLDYVDNSVEFDIGEDTTIDIDGDSYRLTGVRLSPLSLSYTVDAGKTSALNADVLDRLSGSPIVINMKDGAEYNLEEHKNGGGLGDGTKYTQNIQLPRVIDPKQVESITFGSQEVKL